MIEKIYTCNDCKKTQGFSSQEKARAAGWAIARDRKTCYCPVHASAHKNVGRKGAKGQVVTQLPGQIKIALD